MPTTHPLAGVPLLADLAFEPGASVLLRTDWNVPIDRDAAGTRRIADPFRMRASYPTVRALVDRGAQVTVATHLGRPKGAPDPELSVDVLRTQLEADGVGASVLENLRFDPGEEGNDDVFVKSLVDGHDAYVNDAFGVSHRAHASVVGPPRLLPSAAGLLLEREVRVLGDLLAAPAHPFVAIVGGAKVGDKLGVLRALVEVADAVVVGGGMAFTFLAAQGHAVGDSLVDEARIPECAELLGRRAPIHLPSDLWTLPAGEPFGAGHGSGPAPTLRGVEIPDGNVGLDIGPETAAAYRDVIGRAATVLWNGPMGVFEDPRLAGGTRGVAEAVASCPGFTVVGGGDSARAVDELGLSERIGFVSTGGGASLELLEFGDLPGLAALRGAPNAPGGGRR